MRLSTVFELLLIFLLIAFAAYGRVIERDEFTHHRGIRATNGSRQENLGTAPPQTADNVTCTCNTNICNCCRDINIPFVQIKGPGCASLQYLDRDKLAVQLSMGDNILTSTIVDGKKPKPVCFPMPGGLTKFCGRIYSIQREAQQHFKACLRLELESSSELEAALRVSCFRFGPDGVQLRPAEPLPNIVEENKPSDDDDDDDDFFGLGLDDDDDDDDEDDEDDDDEDTPAGNAVPGSSGTSEDDDDDDILSDFGAFIDLLTGDDESDKKKKPQATTSAPLLPFTIPILTKTTTAVPVIVGNELPTGSPGSLQPTTEKIETIAQSIDTGMISNEIPTTAEVSSDEATSDVIGATSLTPDISTSDKESLGLTGVSTTGESSASTLAASPDNQDKIVAEGSEFVEYSVKPDEKVTIVKKVSAVGKKKPGLTSNSPNAIKHDVKKPVVSSVIISKPIKPNPVQTYVVSSQNNVNSAVNPANDDDDDDDILGTTTLDDDDDDDDDDVENEDDDKIETDDDEKHENDETNESEDDKNDEEQHDDEVVEDLIDDDDDDEEEEAEEEEAVLSALVDDDAEKIQDKVSGTVPANHDDDESDYDIGLTDLLKRRKSMRNGRQSKVLRL